MRVQDSKAIGVTTMGNRRKQRVRKSERQNSDASHDDNEISMRCSHLKKCVDINAVKKALKYPAEIGRCQACHSASELASKNSAKNDPHVSGASDSSLSLAATAAPTDHEPSVFLCLQCGIQGCDRYSAEKHAMQHFQTTESMLPHNVVLNVSTFQVWCYVCDCYVPFDDCKRLKECVDFIFKAAGHKSDASSAGVTGARRDGKRYDAVKENGLSFESEQRESSSSFVKDDGRNRQKTMMTASNNLTTPGVLLSFPKVKGLTNLGNTCFFNAVIQNLGQTYLLEYQLREFCPKGFAIELHASLSNKGSRSSTDDEEEEEEVEEEVEEEEREQKDAKKQECLMLSLGESGVLTQSMLTLFDEMKSSGKQNSVTPSALFGQVCKKAPRFKGYQQQDSHELLRYVLDAVRAEEIKRTQAAILKAFKLPENPKAKDISEEDRNKVKAFGRQAKQTFVDGVFGGHFISTVVCSSCTTPHQIFEPFLDISLPLIEEKLSKSSADFCGGKSKDGAKGSKTSTDGPEMNPGTNKQQSKHMTKKERRAARKKGGTKSGKKGATESEKHPPPPPATEQEPEKPDKDRLKSETEPEDAESDAGALERLRSEEGHRDEENKGQRLAAAADDEEEEEEEEDADGAVEQEGDAEQDEAADIPSPDIENGIEMVTILKGHSSSAENGATICLPPSHFPGESLQFQTLNDRDQLNGELEPEENGRIGEDGNASIEMVSSQGGCVREEGETVDTHTWMDEVTCNGHVERENETPHISNDEATCTASVKEENNRFKAHTVTEGVTCNGHTGEEEEEEHRGCVISSRIKGGSESGRNVPGDADVGCGDRLEDCRTVADAVESLHITADDTSRSDSLVTVATNRSSTGKSDKTASLTEMRRRAKCVAMATLVPRVKPGQDYSVLASLYQFTSHEVLSGNNMYRCSVCNRKDRNSNAPGQKQTTVLTCATKQFLVYSPPAVLTLHLKRFQQVGINFRKITRHVEFPEILDLAPFCSALSQNIRSGQRRILYSLFGVVEHSGTLRSGHYTAYVKVRQANPGAKQYLQTLASSHPSLERLVERVRMMADAKDTDIGTAAEEDASSSSSSNPSAAASSSSPSGKWFYISDSHVSEVKSVANVLNCQAYLLFYERIE